MVILKLKINKINSNLQQVKLKIQDKIASILTIFNLIDQFVIDSFIELMNSMFSILYVPYKLQYKELLNLQTSIQ